MPIGKRKRCRRFNEPNEAHFLTFCCFRGQAFLSRDRACQWLVDATESALVKHPFHLWAYVFMPNHVHLIVWPTQPHYSISKLLSSIKIPVTSRAVDFVRNTNPDGLRVMLDHQPNGKQAYRFWQRGGGYDYNLWDPKHIWEKIDYIHRNPVRRELCRRAMDWRWSSAAYHCEQRPGPLTLNLEFLPTRIDFVKRNGVTKTEIE